MNPNSKLWYLEKISLLDDLSEGELKEMEEKTTMKTAEKDSYIYFPHEPSKVVFFLKEGRVKIGTYSEDGKEVIKTILYPGEMFGELGLAGYETRNDWAKAMDDNVRFCTLSVEDALDIMRHNPDFNIKVTKQIGDRLVKLERKLEALVFKDSRTRIIEFIRDLGKERGRKVGFETLIEHSLTHQDMANLTATSRQTVTTILNELKANNLINFDRKSILIRDIDKLE